MAVTWNFGFFSATWKPQQEQMVVPDRGHELVGPLLLASVVVGTQFRPAERQPGPKSAERPEHFPSIHVLSLLDSGTGNEQIYRHDHTKAG